MDDAEADKGGLTAPISRSAAAERMRVYRQRRKAGLRCLTIELLETEVIELIRRKLLDADARNDHYPCTATSMTHSRLHQSDA